MGQPACGFKKSSESPRAPLFIFSPFKGLPRIYTESFPTCRSGVSAATLKATSLHHCTSRQQHFWHSGSDKKANCTGILFNVGGQTGRLLSLYMGRQCEKSLIVGGSNPIRKWYAVALSLHKESHKTEVCFMSSGRLVHLLQLTYCFFFFAGFSLIGGAKSSSFSVCHSSISSQMPLHSLQSVK